MHPELKQKLDNAFYIIADNLKSTWLSFGRDDFPDDNGIGFRNHCIYFVQAFIYELSDPAPTDKWPNVNFPLLEKLNPQQLVCVIGILHFYILSWDTCRQVIHPKAYVKMLDWIREMYAFPPSEGVTWCELVKNNGVSLSFEEGQKKMYFDIAAIIGADPNDESNQNGWSGVALCARHEHEYDKPAHEKWCSELFAD